MSCEDKGYEVGQEFKVVEGTKWVSEGSIVVLKDDDGSDCPWFLVKEGETIMDNRVVYNDLYRVKNTNTDKERIKINKNEGNRDQG